MKCSFGSDARNMGLKYVLLAGIVVAIGAGVLIIGERHHKKPIHTISSPSNDISNYTVRYLALGDSYTIGQSEPELENFPNQLVARLRTDGISIGLVGNPSVTGYTTQNLITKELPLIPKLKPTFVTILIGVNDFVQGVNSKTFQSNLEYIISDVQQQLPNPKDIVLITIPDFSKTPTGAEFGPPSELEAGVQSFNTIIKHVAVNYQLPLADIFPISQGVAGHPNLIASDGLHPSPEEYMLWVNIIYQTIQQHSIF